MAISVNANLFRAAYISVSTEKTRYYLNGAYIEPHATGKGVIMTATDGHTLLSAYDEDGDMGGSSPVIVGVNAAMLKACVNRDFNTRLTIDGDGTAIVYDVMGHAEQSHEESCRQYKAIIDGTFPDWRRIVPKPDKEVCSATFAYAVMDCMLKAAKALSDSKNPSIRYFGDDPGSAHIVRFGDIEHAFGVALPVRNPGKLVLPSWF